MDELLKERYDLAKDRIVEICTETTVKPDFLDFFQNMAAFLEKTAVILERDEEKLSIEELQKENTELYKELFPQNYTHCYGNPAYAEEKLGEYGRAFTFLYAELRGAIAYAYEKKIWDYTVTAELFLEVYAAFENGELPSVKNVEDMLRSYVNDYCQDMMEQRIAEAVDPQLDFAVRIVMDSDLSDLRYLYRYGEYVSANETGVAEFMNSLSQDEIDSMARTYTEGYRIGFINGRKDITKKKTVNIRYNLGFERMVRAAILQFREMGLEPVIYRHATHAVNKRGNAWIGFVGGNANPQYEYDHRQDQALFMDSDYVQRKLRSMQNAYEKYKDLAAVHGGPACIETFGEEPFAPVSTEGAWALNEAQQKMQVELDNESGQIVNRYIRGDERSFTIIAYPVPEIGNDFPKIFAEIVKINTLDYKQYERIQQTIIETLDTCQWVEIKGKEDNETDLIIHLHELEDVRKQTNFENCVADVNIPVGEVFTSPVLAGTGGILHVKKVYLNGLQFKDLKLVFDCGQVIDYTCSNFKTEEETKVFMVDLYDSIVLKDIFWRGQVRDVDALNRLLEYIVLNPSQTFSPTSIAKYFESVNRKVAPDTIYNYMEKIVAAMIMNKAMRYDIRGKRVLTRFDKYYLTDVGFGKIKNTGFKTEIGALIENVVYNELLVRGYEVYVGKTTKGEIDFVAVKDGKKEYYQVAYLLATEDVIEREFGAYKDIQDNYPKYVLSMDRFDFSRDGIIHQNVIDFLMER